MSNMRRPLFTLAILRTIVPLGSYIKKSRIYLCNASLSNYCQDLENNIGFTGKIREKAGSKF